MQIRPFARRLPPPFICCDRSHGQALRQTVAARVADFAVSSKSPEPLASPSTSRCPQRLRLGGLAAWSLRSNLCAWRQHQIVNPEEHLRGLKQHWVNQGRSDSRGTGLYWTGAALGMTGSLSI